MAATILSTAMTHIRHNHMLLKAVGLNPDAVIQELRDNTALFSDTFACSEAGRKLRTEADYAEEQAHEEFGDAQREIARLLRIVAANLRGRIRYEQEPDPVR